MGKRQRGSPSWYTCLGTTAKIEVRLNTLSLFCASKHSKLRVGCVFAVEWGMQVMFCVDGICMVLKVVGWKNEHSCIRRRRNAYSALCPQMWISLDRDVRWERHIRNTCFYICVFFFPFGRQCACIPIWLSGPFHPCRHFFLCKLIIFPSYF